MSCGKKLLAPPADTILINRKHDNRKQTRDFFEKRRWTSLQIIKFHFCCQQLLNNKIVRWSIFHCQLCSSGKSLCVKSFVFPNLRLIAMFVVVVVVNLAAQKRDSFTKSQGHDQSFMKEVCKKFLKSSLFLKTNLRRCAERLFFAVASLKEIMNKKWLLRMQMKNDTPALCVYWTCLIIIPSAFRSLLKIG